MHVGNLCLQFEDAIGALGGVADSGQSQHRGDVTAIELTGSRHMRRGGEIVFAVGHSQAALEQVWDIVLGIIERLRDPYTEQVGSLEMGAVEWVHVRSQI